MFLNKGKIGESRKPIFFSNCGGKLLNLSSISKTSDLHTNGEWQRSPFPFPVLIRCLSCESMILWKQLASYVAVHLLSNVMWETPGHLLHVV